MIGAYSQQMLPLPGLTNGGFKFSMWSSRCKAIRMYELI